MFEDSLFDYSESMQHRRGWTALASFAGQVLLVGIGIILPMLFTQALPKLWAPRDIILPTREMPRPIRTVVVAQRQSEQPANVNPELIHMPRNIPRSANEIGGSFSDVGIKAGPEIPNGFDGSGQISSLLGSGPTVVPILPASGARRFRVSGGVAQGLLIRDVRPIYPLLARQAGVQGDVVLQAIIGKDGRIENLRAVSGNPLLIRAALDAVQQWRYRPYSLNGEPVEVETQITVRFNIS